MLMPLKPFYRYDLKVEIPATEVAVLVDALEGEYLALRAWLGEDELRRQIEEQALDIEVVSSERCPEFQRDIEALSVYLSEQISGREIHVEPGPVEPLFKGWAILGRRGETERIALDLAWDPDNQVLVNRGVDESEAQRRWKDLPEWVRSSLTQSGMRCE
jgi:hypothetical protein